MQLKCDVYYIHYITLLISLYAEYELTSKRYKVELVPEHFAILLEKANRFGGIKYVHVYLCVVFIFHVNVHV